MQKYSRLSFRFPGFPHPLRGFRSLGKLHSNTPIFGIKKNTRLRPFGRNPLRGFLPLVFRYFVHNPLASLGITHASHPWNHCGSLVISNLDSTRHDHVGYFSTLRDTFSCMESGYHIWITNLDAESNARNSIIHETIDGSLVLFLWKSKIIIPNRKELRFRISIFWIHILNVDIPHRYMENMLVHGVMVTVANVPLQRYILVIYPLI